MSQTVGAQFKSMSIMHYALCGGVAIALFLFRYLIKNNNAMLELDNNIIEIIGVAVAFVAVLASRFLFFMRTKQALYTPKLADKLFIFRTAFVFQMAILKGAAFLNAVLYYITHKDIHFFIGIGILLLMIVRRPTRSMAAMVLFTDMEDRQLVYDDMTEL